MMAFLKNDISRILSVQFMSKVDRSEVNKIIVERLILKEF